MRAAVVPRLGPADVLDIRPDWPEPGPPGPGEVGIEVHAAGLNPSDVKLRGGGALTERLPWVAGREAAGVVVALGPGVGHLAVGDAVFAFFGWHGQPGGHAERVVVPARMVARRPAGVPVAVAAAVPLAGITAVQALRLLGAPPGARIGVCGASGGVGVFAVQLAVRAGLSVVATTGPRNLDFVAGLGATTVVDHHDPAVADAFDGVGYLLDLVGPGPVADYQGALAAGARLVSIVALPERLRPDLDAHAMRAEPGSADLATLAALLADGALRVEVERTFPLESLADAHRLLEAGHVRGKLVIGLRR